MQGFLCKFRNLRWWALNYAAANGTSATSGTLRINASIPPHGSGWNEGICPFKFFAFKNCVTTSFAITDTPCPSALEKLKRKVQIGDSLRIYQTITQQKYYLLHLDIQGTEKKKKTRNTLPWSEVPHASASALIAGTLHIYIHGWIHSWWELDSEFSFTSCTSRQRL